MREEILRFYRVLERRWRWLAFRDRFLEWSFALVILLAIGLLADRIAALLAGRPPLADDSSTILLSLALLLLVSLVVAAIHALLRTVPRSALAGMVDGHLRSEEMFLTSLEVIAAEKESPLRERLLRETRDRLAAADQGKILQAPPIGYRWGTAAAMFVILFLALTPTIFTEDGRNDRRRDVEAGSERSKAEGAQLPGNDGQRKSPHRLGAAGTNSSGDGPSDDIFGPKPERPKAAFAPEAVTPLVGVGEFVEKEKTIFTGRKGEEEREEYRKAYGRYRRVAEEAIVREEIPPPVRDLVRAYFDRIKPE